MRSTDVYGDLPTTPYDIEAEVDALWNGLQRLAPNHSFVLVAHSYGAFLTALFAAKHPQVVKGIVFIDPSTMTFMDALGGPAALKEDPLSAPPYDRSRPDLLNKNQKAELRVFDGIDKTAAFMRSAALDKSLPVRVITAGRPWWPTADRNLAWRAAHERLAGSVSDGRLVVAERSGHLVTRNEPDLIVTAVSELVRQVRAEK